MHNEIRQPHAVLDLPSRAWKAEKIARFLALSSRKQPLRILEIGTGSGGIAHWFAHHPELRCDVAAVDVCDNRQLHDGYAFQLVEGTELPFTDASFDVAISNHVIEHVGNVEAQMRHLGELRRVLKPDGVGYLAVPNRWMLTEPHYRLKFLSWLPHGWRTPYLRWRGKGDFYDCKPLQLHELETMLDRSGVRYQNLCVEGWRATLDIERPTHLGTRLLTKVPDAILRLFNPVNPTLIYQIGRMDG